MAVILTAVGSFNYGKVAYGWWARIRDCFERHQTGKAPRARDQGWREHLTQLFNAGFDRYSGAEEGGIRLTDYEDIIATRTTSLPVTPTLDQMREIARLSEGLRYTTQDVIAIMIRIGYEYAC